MLIILDRDGVINQYNGSYICSVDEWLPIPGSIEAVARLYKAGHRLAIATNQSGIARGFYGTDVLDSMHQKMAQLVEAQGGHIDFIAYCPHHPDEHCGCRKPLTGLLDQIRDHLQLSTLEGAVMVVIAARTWRRALRKTAKRYWCAPATESTPSKTFKPGQYPAQA